MARKVVLFGLCIIYLLLGAIGVINANVIEADEEVVQHLLDTSDVFYLEFYSPSCGHCKKFAPVWERVGKALSGAVPVARVNVQLHTALSSRYNVRFVPDVRVFEHKVDKAIDRGTLTPVQLAQVIMAKLPVLAVPVADLAAFLGLGADSPEPDDVIPRVLLLHRGEDERVAQFAALHAQHSERVIFGALVVSHTNADAVAAVLGDVSNKAQVVTAQKQQLITLSAADQPRVEQLLGQLANHTQVLAQTQQAVVATQSRAYSLFNWLFFGAVLGGGYFVYQRYIKTRDPRHQKKHNPHLYV